MDMQNGVMLMPWTHSVDAAHWHQEVNNTDLRRMYQDSGVSEARSLLKLWVIELFELNWNYGVVSSPDRNAGLRTKHVQALNRISYYVHLIYFHFALNKSSLFGCIS